MILKRHMLLLFACQLPCFSVQMYNSLDGLNILDKCTNVQFSCFSSEYALWLFDNHQCIGNSSFMFISCGTGKSWLSKLCVFSDFKSHNLVESLGKLESLCYIGFFVAILVLSFSVPQTSLASSLMFCFAPANLSLLLFCSLQLLSSFLNFPPNFDFYVSVWFMENGG